MNQNTCANCIYGKEAELTPQSLGQPRAVVCRRFPPQMILTPYQGGAALMGHFPSMAPDGWCGEHRPQEH